MDLETKEQLRLRMADIFQEDLADHDTHVRLVNAELSGDFIAEFAPSPEAGTAHWGMVKTDRTDGKWARIAKKVLGYDRPTAGAAEDPKADHALIDQTFRGLSEAAENHKQTKEAKKLRSLRQRQVYRDARQDENRKLIAEHREIDQRELRAGWENKAKMIIISLGQNALCRIGYEKRAQRRLALGAVALGVRFGERGEKKFRAKINRLANPVGRATGPYPFARNRA